MKVTQVFKAFLKVTDDNGNVMELPIYPRNTKTSIFTSIAAAAQRLETIAKKFDQDTTGKVYRYENGVRVELSYQIAL